MIQVASDSVCTLVGAASEMVTFDPLVLVISNRHIAGITHWKDILKREQTRHSPILDENIHTRYSSEHTLRSDGFCHGDFSIKNRVVRVRRDLGFHKEHI